ncbi:arylsulfatase [Flavihumibacter solisilvae]|uniref:Arylsulfatase n=2 Tax=Flavihumibacter solisilvae TaxID=1349421 RepID=A0A0C1LKI6_9BACT|nr:arylsulfatase [Flavihumibacter solisilvae]
MTAIFFLFTLFAIGSFGQDGKRPNVIVILMDDMGYGDPACYGGGPYRTPNIDRLAAAGIRFTNYYAAQAVCTASRSGLLTGCYPTRIGISGAIDHNAKFALNPDEQTIAELMRDGGYATGMVGKWHLGHKVPFLPLQHGFDEFYGLPYSNDMWAYDYNGERWKDTSFWRAKYPPLPLIDGNTTTKIISTFDDQDQLTGSLTKRAVDFINRNRKRSFFLYFAHPMVHVPLGVSGRFKGKSGAGLFGDVMEEVDWSVGEVMRTLKENKLDQNTIVIFTSDNGPWLTFGNHAGNTGGLREGKGTAWEGGLKVPFIVSWPGRIRGGLVRSNLVTAMDLLPTLVNICHLSMPVKKIDGVDFTELLTGKGKSNPRDEFAYYYDRNSLKAIRKGKWKLVFPANSQTYGPPATLGKDRYPGRYGSIEVKQALYDLSTDPGEDRDVQDLYPEVVRELIQVANRYRSELGDGLTNTVGQGVRQAGVVKE